MHFAPSMFLILSRTWGCLKPGRGVKTVNLCRMQIDIAKLYVLHRKSTVGLPFVFACVYVRFWHLQNVYRFDIPELHKNIGIWIKVFLDKPTWLFANNFMFYFFILSNFKPVITGHTWQQVARRIPLNLIESDCTTKSGTCRAYAKNNCAEMILNKIFIEGLSFSFK